MYLIFVRPHSGVPLFCRASLGCTSFLSGLLRVYLIIFQASLGCTSFLSGSSHGDLQASAKNQQTFEKLVYTRTRIPERAITIYHELGIREGLQTQERHVAARLVDIFGWNNCFVLVTSLRPTVVIGVNTILLQMYTRCGLNAK